MYKYSMSNSAPIFKYLLFVYCNNSTRNLINHLMFRIVMTEFDRDMYWQYTKFRLSILLDSLNFFNQKK